jgi:hypothetical protein
MVAGNIYIVPIKMPSVAESKARLEELDPDNTTGWRDVAKPHHANFTKRVRELEAAQGATEAESDDEGDASDGDMSEEESEDEDFSTPSKVPVDVPPGLQHAHEQLTGIMSKKFAASPASAIEVVAAAGETAKQRAQDSNPAPPVPADEYETHVDTVVAHEINNIADDPAHDESMDADEFMDASSKNSPASIEAASSFSSVFSARFRFFARETVCLDAEFFFTSVLLTFEAPFPLDGDDFRAFDGFPPSLSALISSHRFL